MRVAFISYQWPGVRMGGIGSYVRQSAAALALAGHEPHVFTLGDPNTIPDNVPDGVTLHQTLDPAQQVLKGTLPAELAAVINGGGEAVYRLAIAWLLTAAFSTAHREQPFDIVEVADVDASGLPLLLDDDRPLPVIAHLHTCTAIANRINHVKLGPQETLIEAMESAQIHLADALCAPTLAVVGSTQELVALDRAAQIIPHPYVCGNSQFTTPPDDGPILFVGRIEWRKGCGVIAETLNEFFGRHPAARFRFIGPDTSSAPGGTSMRAYIVESLNPAAKQRVEFTGELPLPQVEQALKECSFCVLPSLSENFSLAVCEAMAAGRTTIVAENTGSVELIGDAGVNVEPGSAPSLLAAMDSIYRNRRARAGLARLAFDRIRNLCDPVKVSQQRVAFYQKVIADFSRRESAYTTKRLTTLPAGVAAVMLPCISRLTAALVQVETAADSPGRRLSAICDTITSSKHEPARLLLYGAGKHTARLLSERHAWERHGHRVVGIIDDHPKFHDSPTFLDLPVRSLAAVEAAIKGGQMSAPVVLSTDTYEDQFWEKTSSLRSLGVPVFRLYGQRSSYKKAV